MQRLERKQMIHKFTNRRFEVKVTEHEPLDEEPDSLLELLELLHLLFLRGITFSISSAGKLEICRSFPPISTSSSIISLPENKEHKSSEP